MKILSAHPNSIEPFSFKIIWLVKQQSFV